MNRAYQLAKVTELGSELDAAKKDLAFYVGVVNKSHDAIGNLAPSPEHLYHRVQHLIDLIKLRDEEITELKASRGIVVTHEMTATEKDCIIAQQKAQIEYERVYCREWSARAISAENKLRAAEQGAVTINWKDRAFKLRRRLAKVTGMMRFVAENSEKFLKEEMTRS